MSKFPDPIKEGLTIACWKCQFPMDIFYTEDGKVTYVCSSCHATSSGGREEG